MDLAGSAALITGGKRIGAAVAIDLAQRGMDIALSFNRSREEADETAAAIRAVGRRAFVFAADLSRGEACEALVTEAAAALGRLDVLINMASVYAAVPLDETDEAAWDRVVDVDLKASYLCARAAIPHMRAAGGGRIINFADWVAASGRPRYKGFLPYYVAKRGVVGLTEALALELAADRILVNAVAPGPILPPTGSTDEEATAVELATPLGRWGGEDEIVRAVVFLLETGFTTGETIRVDGGRHVR
ncbi:MAG TPA: SDR family oxidoreductase [Vicinamibacterales bacterium]|nr:SDR family oxidoreductase [Vicinamibacterales bacterium]